MDPNTVEKNDIVYVRSDFLESFFRDMHPHIQEKYILISHNDDVNIGEDYVRFIDKKILHWFVQNLLFKHEKVTPIPIGLQNFRYHHIGKLGFFDQKDIKKEAGFSIKYNFSRASNPERISAEDSLKRAPSARKIAWSDQGEYYETVKASHFIASPQGRGIDCHRTWEAIYLGAVPIVMNGPAMRHFKEIGMPIFLIDSWDEVGKLTSGELERIYNDIYNAGPFPQAYLEYWKNEIMNKKI